MGSQDSDCPSFIFDTFRPGVPSLTLRPALRGNVRGGQSSRRIERPIQPMRLGNGANEKGDK